MKHNVGLDISSELIKKAIIIGKEYIDTLKNIPESVKIETLNGVYKDMTRYATAVPIYDSTTDAFHKFKGIDYPNFNPYTVSSVDIISSPVLIEDRINAVFNERTMLQMIKFIDIGKFDGYTDEFLNIKPDGCCTLFIMYLPIVLTARLVDMFNLIELYMLDTSCTPPICDKLRLGMFINTCLNKLSESLTMMENDTLYKLQFKSVIVPRFNRYMDIVIPTISSWSAYGFYISDISISEKK